MTRDTGSSIGDGGERGLRVYLFNSGCLPLSTVVSLWLGCDLGTGTYRESLIRPYAHPPTTLTSFKVGNKGP